MKKTIRLDGETPSEKGFRVLEFILTFLRGQDKAVRPLADAIEVFESGMFPGNRPIFVGLASGTSGVGKTYTAELLAEYWFGSRKAFTKIKCEEFSESHRISELKGSPAGYIGYWDPENPENSGTPPILWQGNIDKFALDADPDLIKISRDFQVGEEEISRLNDALAQHMDEISELFDDNGVFDIERWPKLSKKLKESFPLILARKKITDRLNELGHTQPFMWVKRPKSIILFDEIEKAHPDLLNILLSIMDKGEFQLANGMVTDFSNSVILITTNVGSRKMAAYLNPKNKIGFVSDKRDCEAVDQGIYKEALKEIKEFFRPEFLGRVDKIIVYRPLRPDTLRDIIDVELREFQKIVLKSLPITFVFDEKVKEFIFKESLDKPEDGARLIKLKILKHLRVPLCRLKNKGQLKAGDVINIRLNEQSKIIIEKDEDEEVNGNKV